MPHKCCTGIDIATRKVYQGSEVLNGEYPQVYVKRQPDGPTNRHKNDPLVRVGYLRQETA